MRKLFAATGMKASATFTSISTPGTISCTPPGSTSRDTTKPSPIPSSSPIGAALARKLGIPHPQAIQPGSENTACGTLIRRFGTWQETSAPAFRTFAARNPQWKDILPLLDQPANPPPPAFRTLPTHTTRPRRPWKSARVPNGRPICGDLLQVGPMRNAPLNEMGVVFLFAILAPALGFQIEALQPSFPDCEAKRRVGPGARPADRAVPWQSVRIEFECESPNFRNHGHPPGGCDMIVCWDAQLARLLEKFRSDRVERRSETLRNRITPLSRTSGVVPGAGSSS